DGKGQRGPEHELQVVAELHVARRIEDWIEPSWRIPPSWQDLELRAEEVADEQGEHEVGEREHRERRRVDRAVRPRAGAVGRDDPEWDRDRQRDELRVDDQLERNRE